MLKITHVTCEHQSCPLAVETQHLRFAWEPGSDEANTVQTAYRILVWGPEDNLVWDSGRTESNQTYEITYEGSALESAKRYTYQVQVWDNHGNTAASEIQRFETGYFHAGDWKACWIEPEPLPQLSENPLPKAQAIWKECLMAMMRGEQPEYYTDGDIWNTLPTEPYDPPVRFRRTFELKEKPEYAKVYMTAHGIYSLSVNGQKVPGTFLAPGFTTYGKRLKYQAYDITDFLKGGENAISVTVADGWYKGKIALGKGCEYGEVPGLLMQTEIWYPDGTRTQICSDEAFTYSFDGPIRYADLFTGECVDARKYDGEPSEVSYQAKNWKPVIPAKRDRYDFGILTAQNAPEIEVYEEIPAKEILTTPKGETVVDFGQNMAGIIRVEISAKEGEEISFEHGEVLDANGNFTYAFTDTTRAQKNVYISAGRKGEVFEPEFTYHGFRYVKVTGGENWKPEQFTAKAISSANLVTGSFQCSDEKLNRLQHNIYWSQRSNTIGIPTDCPTREKAGWTGDVVVYGATALYNQEMTAFFEDWLESIRREQNEAGHVLNTVPLIKNYVQQTMAGSLGWGDVILTLPLQLYHLFGNKKALEDNYDAMEKWMKAMQQAAYELPENTAFNPEMTMNPDKRKTEKNTEGEQAAYSDTEDRHQENQHYLINTGFHFGDWLVPSVKNEAGFSDGPASSFLTMNVVDTALLAADADMLAEISAVLHKPEKAEEYERYAERVREALYEELCEESGKLKQEMQGNYILALKHHMIPKEMEEKFAGRLAEMIAENGNKPDTGFMSVAYILDMLCDYGYRELAWVVLNQNGCPGWIYEVEHGATTMWENWDAIRPDGQADGCSFNHYAFGCVGDFLYRRVLGIQNAGIGYDRIRLEPGYDFPLEWAEGTYHSVHGDIKLRWEKGCGGILISCNVPVNTEAVLILPDGCEKKLASGVSETFFSYAVEKEKGRQPAFIQIK